MLNYRSHRRVQDRKAPLLEVPGFLDHSDDVAIHYISLSFVERCTFLLFELREEMNDIQPIFRKMEHFVEIATMKSVLTLLGLFSFYNRYFELEELNISCYLKSLPGIVGKHSFQLMIVLQIATYEISIGLLLIYAQLNVERTTFPQSYRRWMYEVSQYIEVAWIQ